MRVDMPIPVIALALFPLCIVAVAVKRFRLRKKLGSLRSPFPRKSQLQFIGILACTPVLPLLIFIRNFDALTQIAVSGTGLLGFYIALYDLLLIRIGGCYDNGILWNAGVALFADIVSWSRVDPRTVEIVDARGARKVLSFPDETTAGTAISCLESAVHPLP